MLYYLTRCVFCLYTKSYGKEIYLTCHSKVTVRSLALFTECIHKVKATENLMLKRRDNNDEIMVTEGWNFKMSVKMIEYWNCFKNLLQYICIGK